MGNGACARDIDRETQCEILIAALGRERKERARNSLCKVVGDAYSLGLAGARFSLLLHTLAVRAPGATSCAAQPAPKYRITHNPLSCQSPTSMPPPLNFHSRRALSSCARLHRRYFGVCVCVWLLFFSAGVPMCVPVSLAVQLWDVGNDTLRNQDVSGLWKLTVLTSVVSRGSLWLGMIDRVTGYFSAVGGLKILTSCGYHPYATCYDFFVARAAPPVCQLYSRLLATPKHRVDAVV